MSEFEIFHLSSRVPHIMSVALLNSSILCYFLVGPISIFYQGILWEQVSYEFLTSECSSCNQGHNIWQVVWNFIYLGLSYCRYLSQLLILPLDPLKALFGWFPSHCYLLSRSLLCCSGKFFHMGVFFLVTSSVLRLSRWVLTQGICFFVLVQWVLWDLK